MRVKIDPENLDRKGVHDLLIGAVLPRPVALISTVGADGIYNLAPYSFFVPVSMKPALVGLAISPKPDGGKKDTLVNIEWGQDFVVNVVTEAMAEPMNQAAGEYPREVDEFQVTGLTPIQSDLVKSPRVAESPVNLECRVLQVLAFGEPSETGHFVIGEVLRVHVQDEYWANGAIESSKLKTIGRLGGELYCRTTDIFEMKRPVIQTKP